MTRHLVLAAAVLAATVLAACGGTSAEADPPTPPPAPAAPTAEPPPAPPATDTPRAELEAARARWRELGLESYSLRQHVLCFCPPEATGPFVVSVEGGAVAGVVFAPGGPEGEPSPDVLVRTVDDLFAAIDDALAGDVARLDVEYDRETGVPTRVWVDESEQIADEEIGWESELTEETASPAPPGTPTEMTAEEREAALAELTAARTRWIVSAPARYALEERVVCFCPPEYTGPFEVTVEAGKVVDVAFAPGGSEGEPPAEAEVYSVEGLFDRIERELAEAGRVVVEYDPETGLPASVQVDRITNAIDDEIGWTVKLVST